jgi:hypothetical protein
MSLAASAHLLLASIHPSAWKGHSQKFGTRALPRSFEDSNVAQTHLQCP